MNRDKARAAIYCMAAFYMLYTAMQLYKEQSGMPAIVFFVAAAIFLIVFALIIAKRVTEEEKKAAEENRENESETD